MFKGMDYKMVSYQAIRAQFAKVSFPSIKVSIKMPSRLVKVFNSFKPLKTNLAFLALALGLLIADQSTLIWAPKVGVYINALAIAGLVGLAITKDSLRKTCISMAILPISTMITASAQLNTNLGRMVVFYASLLLLTFVYRLIFTLDFPLSSTKLGLKGYILFLPLMLIIGEIIGVVGYFLLRHHYPFSHYSLVLICFDAIAFAFTEEMFLRGLIQQQGSKAFHPVIAAITSAILYVFLSIDKSNWLTVVVAMILGSTLSFVYYKKQNLMLTTTINAFAKLTYIGLVVTFVLH